MNALRRILVWLFVAAFLAEAVWLGTRGDLGLYGFVGFAVVGAVVITERPGNRMGWFLLGIAFGAAVVYAPNRPQTAVELPAELESIIWAFSWGFWGLFWLIGVLFPSGRAQTRLGRIAVWLAVGYGIVNGVLALLSTAPLVSGRPNPFAVPAIAGLTSLTSIVSFVVLPLLAAATVTDLVLRWRRADALGRLQYRWLVFGVATMIVVVILALALGSATGATDPNAPQNQLAQIALNLPPIAIGIAVTRHGLYEIGRVVSRTVTYTIALALAIGVYAGLVIGLTALIPGLPSVGVALATLAAAAIFLPVLRWVQRRLDRAFDRERYNAEQVVEAFGTRLRDDVDPDTTTPELIAAIERTLQPSAVGLWTKNR